MRILTLSEAMFRQPLMADSPQVGLPAASLRPRHHCRNTREDPYGRDDPHSVHRPSSVPETFGAHNTGTWCPTTRVATFGLNLVYTTEQLIAQQF
jgi:hypothetical protein